MPLLSAGIAFYGLLALVPAMVATVSVYGLVANPENIDQQVQDALGAAPAEVRSMVSSQLTSIARGSTGGTAVALVIGVIVALWSASSGMAKLISALNAAYDEHESRGFLRLRATSLALTLGAILFFIVAVGTIAALPAVIHHWNLGGAGRVGVEITRFLLLAAAMVAALSVLYRVAPDHDRPRWRWASVGALIATAIWLIASVGFSIYTSNFATYNETYGTLGAAVIVMLWLMISAAAVLIGAEVDHELARRRAPPPTATAIAKVTAVAQAPASPTPTAHTPAAAAPAPAPPPALHLGSAALGAAGTLLVGLVRRVFSRRGGAARR